MTNSRIDFEALIPSIRRSAAIWMLLSLCSGLIGISARAQQKQKATTSRLSDEQRILHVLNRLGFGARPGDVERVKAMGVERYIEQQLNPGKISDALAETKVKDLPTLSMSTAQLYEKYPQPGQLIRQLQRRGDLPDDLAAARQNKGKASESQTPGQPASGESMTPDAMPNKGNEPGQSGQSWCRGERTMKSIVALFATTTCRTDCNSRNGLRLSCRRRASCERFTASASCRRS